MNFKNEIFISKTLIFGILIRFFLSIIGNTDVFTKLPEVSPNATNLASIKESILINEKFKLSPYMDDKYHGPPLLIPLLKYFAFKNKQYFLPYLLADIGSTYLFYISTKNLKISIIYILYQIKYIMLNLV